MKRLHIVALVALLFASFEFGCLIQRQRDKLQVGEAHQPSAVQPRRVLRGIPKPDPLETAELENYLLKTSGLLEVRPPLQPAETGDAFLRLIPFQVLSWAPRIVNYPGFIDKARCEAIINLAKRSLHRSGLALGPGQKPVDQDNVRTSSGTFLSGHNDPDGVLAWLEERIAAATLIPASHGEPFNVLRYEHNQHYDSHMDTFDPKQFGPQRSQRIATVLIYLSDVEEGGETIFKREGLGNGNRVITDWRSCDDGFKYKPRQGDAVLFWSTHPGSTEIDRQGLHGGCPVTKGEKWVATKWLHSQRASYDRLAELARDH
uniref:Fe2OG dioxygenase domain-containing protein n=2 Tax=Dunaliella tertiolecta TaxID=3047 RepID=A0A7S3R2Q1_DUNTE|mmetsp:Transcript_19668/g.54882  ORF Transcript_19668/g.54882 Transcript_19668/m.54882 type:complete len:317 (+) Transcript_19668:37-987(+)|eukprot:CAMPEP_0202387564 /NCGR_PEP_ID=MMETSP1127-20130417/72805_1 /ASSEMBLY_ACC=CAM_ASM_000462 /TAXON_ID=3047 /ORGANISM="Dunaliella tertiolecta, Strain CCMP1320" /LENGTH=316 /DNA_ID=CAMNT_0048988627 /DNA_START=47 /DNA_END=997 /DNA_ORIENTATION=-